MVTAGLLRCPDTWRCPIKRYEGCEKVGEEFDARRLSRLPSPASLSALASIFNMATDPSDIVVTSVMAILCAAPERINEALRLGIDSEVLQKDSAQGPDVYGLRWFPSKGAAPQVKWIINSMTDVVKKAFLNVRRIGDPARKIAEWYESNPTRLFLPDELQYLRGKEYLTKEYLAELLFDGPVARTVTDYWCKGNQVAIYQVHGKSCVRFDEVERAVISMLPMGFPIADRDHGLRYSKMLFLIRRNELHSARTTYRCMFSHVGTGDINVRLSAKSHLSKSIFEKHNFREPDGGPISTSTHKIRHYLNTLAQLGGMSQLDIALWSGRARVSENNVYDHVSNRDVLEMVRAAVGDPDRAKGPLARLRGTQLVNRSDFAKLKVATAHTTDFGYCIHDFSLLPCQAHQDCLNCDEQVCVKGDSEKVVRLKLLIKETRDLLSKAEIAQHDQLAGSDRWVRHQKRTMERAESLLRILENPSVPAGSVISVSVTLMPSRLAMAVEERQKQIQLAPKSAVGNAQRRGRS